MGYLLNGVESGGIPERLVKALKAKFDIPYFIETGTAGGDTVRQMAPLFEECHTIELIEGRPSGDFSENVKFYKGHSHDRLSEILREINTSNGYILFWLDAHYTDDVPNTSGNKECPLIEELWCIDKCDNPVIIIDDARLFYGHPPYPLDPRDWPTLKQIMEFLFAHWPHHFVTIIDDYIVCLPSEMHDVFQEEWRGNYKFRYPNADGQLKQALKTIIKRAHEFIS